MNITLCNCKNIEQGVIHVDEGKLNIKYAINGTGKSTIAQAIDKKVKGESLSSLKPLKYIKDHDNAHDPSVDISSPINQTIIFNENYIERYLFKKTELVENSYEIFIKTQRYDEQMKEIEDSVKCIRDTFQNDPELTAL